MAEIVDAFVATLGLDDTDYKKKSREYRDDRKRLAEEEQKQNRISQDGQSRTVAGLRTLRNETAGFLLMLAGATSLVGFAKDMLTADAATGRFARNTGMATERVSVWENALKQVGGTAQEAQQALGTLFGIFQNYQLTGDLSKGGALAFFGLSERDLKDPEAALLRISEVVKNMPREDVEARLATLGLSGSIVGLLAGDRGELGKLLASVEAAGVANDDSAEAAMDLEAELAKTAQTLQGIARPAVTELATAFTQLTGIVNDMIGPMGAVRDWFMSIADSNVGKMISGGDYKNIWDYIGEGVGGRGGQLLKERWGSQGKGGSGGGGAGIGGMIQRNLDLFSGAMGGGSNGTPPATGGRPRGRLTRAERNNNPGNIEDGAFARRQYGYVGGDGRFAKFSSADAGFAAMENLLRGRGYAGGGRNTIAKIISKYAPSSENNVGAYASAVERATGINRHKPLSPAEIRAVSRAMARHEGYRGGSVDIAAGSTYVARRGPQSSRAAGGASSNQSNVTTVGQINVYTPAANAEGITRDIRSAMAARGLVVQAGNGLRP